MSEQKAACAASTHSRFSAPAYTPGARAHAAARAAGSHAPWVSMNLFFRHVVEPRFDLFGACDPAARAAAWARAPGVYAGALKRLGVEAAQAAFCSLHGRNFRNERIG